MPLIAFGFGTYERCGKERKTVDGARTSTVVRCFRSQICRDGAGSCEREAGRDSAIRA